MAADEMTDSGDGTSQVMYGEGQAAWLALVTVLAFGALVLAIAAFVMASDNGGGGGGTGAAPTAEAAGGGDVAKGEEVFGSSCASCHGTDAQGLPNLGSDLTASEFAQGLSDDELLAFINEGRDADDPENASGVAMPPKGGNSSLSDEDISAVVSYLRTLEG